MPSPRSCPQGHHWEQADGPTEPLHCPVCAKAVSPPSSEGDGGPPSATVTLPPSAPHPENAAECATLPPTGAAVAPPNSDPKNVPGYEVLGELGRGGMGVVYKARQVRLKRIVALKMILGGGHAGEEELARFRTEAEAVARLQHPHIVQIYEVGEHEGLPYFSLEFCRRRQPGAAGSAGRRSRRGRRPSWCGRWHGPRTRPTGPASSTAT